jgi:hypothetical protein
MMESPGRDKTKQRILTMTSSTMMKKRRKRRRVILHQQQLLRRRKKQKRLSLRVVQEPLIMTTILPTNNPLNLCTTMIHVAAWAVKYTQTTRESTSTTSFQALKKSKSSNPNKTMSNQSLLLI